MDENKQAGVPPEATDPDPMPQAPVEPPLEACCGNGCNPCIFDEYGDALRQYRQALAQWQQRHRGDGDQA